MEDWKQTLIGKGTAASRSGNVADLVDLSPLPEPVNGFGFAATLIKRHGAPANKEDRETWEQQVSWLEHLATVIPYETVHPCMAIAIGRIACLQTEREHVGAVIQGLNEIIAGYNESQSGT